MSRPRAVPFTVALCVLGPVLGMPGVGTAAQGPAQTGTRPTLAAAAAASVAAGTNTADCGSSSSCYSPREFEAAYGISSLLAYHEDGAGQTVVLPELAEPQFPLPTSDIRADLAEFDKLFGLPAAHLKAVAALAPSASPWLANGEEVLDTEVVHAAAPGATIVELLVSGGSLNNPTEAVAASVAALRLGSTLGGVISISAAGQTGGEGCDSRAQVAKLHSALQLAAARHVTVVAASGDIGSVGEPCKVIVGLTGGNFLPMKQVNLPAADPLVLAAGGTRLSVDPKSGAYAREGAWGLPCGDPGSQFQASGGGFSRIVAKPSYQAGVAGIGAYRGVPDVAADACPETGFPVVMSNGGGGYTISGHGGTSASAPLWAGVVAIADQYAGRHLGFIDAAIYRVARSAAYKRAFHDVTTGDNSADFPGKNVSGYTAGPGWDAVTGWGSPDAAVLVPLLARYVQAGDANSLRGP